MIETGDGHTTDTRRVSRIRRYHSIYDPAELCRLIRQLKGSSTPDKIAASLDDDAAWHGEADPATLPAEDINRLRALERIAADSRGHRRRSIMGSTAMVRKIEAVSFAMPHFAPAIDIVSRAALVSARTETPLRVPPILLLGEPGIGKSYTLRRLAEAIDADFSLIAANITDAFRLRGMNTAWRGARAGRIAEILLGASTTPIVLVDEFDKAVGDQIQRPYDVWHSLLERENANVFKDDFLEIELHADRIVWFASANDVSVLPGSIRDRFLVLEIPAPNREQLRIVVASIYSGSRKGCGDALPEHAPEDVTEELSRHSPRRIGRLIDLAIGFAAADGRRRLNVDDIRLADSLASSVRSDLAGFRGPVGFTNS